MALQNRVLPTGEIVALAARGTMMGNRGGALHDEERTLGRRRWVSRRWICCVLDFKARRRSVMSPGRYTELFFLDEATALAAGHRPCFECRRTDAVSFAAFWSKGQLLHKLLDQSHDMTRVKSRDLSTDEIDRQLHAERVGGDGQPRRHRLPLAALPPGSFYLCPETLTPRVMLPGCTMAWTPDGYVQPLYLARPDPELFVEALTPPSIQAALRSGYLPGLHLSAAGHATAR